MVMVVSKLGSLAYSLLMTYALTSDLVNMSWNKRGNDFFSKEGSVAYSLLMTYALTSDLVHMSWNKRGYDSF